MSDAIKIDPKNFNKHSDAGMELLKKSVETVGIIESVTVSSDNVILSGNARKSVFDDVIGEVEPIVIESDGKRPVVIKRTDIKSGTKEFYTAALLANTTAKQNINLNIDLIQEVAVDEFDIDIIDLGVDIIDFDYTELEGLSENSLRDQIKASGQIQITFLFDKEHKNAIDNYMNLRGKQTLQNELLRIIQNA